jgi:chlorobactene glucosyltransferase
MLAFLIARMARVFAPLPTPSAADQPPDGPQVSIIVPATNEERNIRPCLESLLAQQYPNLEVIVVDDESTDGTGELARPPAAGEPRLTVVQGTPLPPGWIGKNHAAHQGIQRARGQWFLFTDADMVHSPQALVPAPDLAAREKADTLCLYTHQYLDTFQEKVVQPAVLVAVFALDGTT